MIRDCKLTTFDNPFDPFDDFDSWYQFDCEHDYNSCSRIDRIANITNDMSSVEIDREIERAIDEIIFYDAANIYKKLVREYPDEE